MLEIKIEVAGNGVIVWLSGHFDHVPKPFIFQTRLEAVGFIAQRCLETTDEWEDFCKSGAIPLDVSKLPA